MLRVMSRTTFKKVQKPAIYYIHIAFRRNSNRLIIEIQIVH